MRAGLLLLAAGLLHQASGAAIDNFVFETDDAIIVEAADLADIARAKRQLWPKYPNYPPTVVPPGWPGLPAGVTNECSTPSGRSGLCVARSACFWVREASEQDLNSLMPQLGECTVEGLGRKGEPALRGVCCPGLGTPTTPQSGQGSTTGWWQTTTEVSSATNWWQTTDSATTSTTRQPPTSTRGPSGTQWWQTTTSTTSRPVITSRVPPAAPGVPAFITHPWQATNKPSVAPGGLPPGIQPAPTHAWQATGSTRPTTSATRPPAGTTSRPEVTHWWQTTGRPATTQRPTSGSTGWWQTTTKRTTTRRTTISRRPGGNPQPTNWWQSTAKPTPAPPSGGFGACGTRSVEQDRIVGGGEAAKGEFPWIAGIFKRGRQFCGGSLIDSTHILTAAHCVAHMSSYDVSQLLVRLGDHDISSPFEAKHATYKVARIVRHKGFSEQTLHDDIALITLTKDVEFKNNIRPVCLATGSDDYAGDTVVVAGWGSLREGGRQPSKLQKVSLTVWKNPDCAKTYGRQAPGGIISSMLCAGRQGKDSCSGDSGGPLMKVAGVVYQVGVVSWGIGCGKAQYPGVYTRVSALMDWINRNRQAY